MNAREMQQADAGTELEVVAPVLLNTFKHHAGSLRERIERLAARGEAALAVAAESLVVLGNGLMDFYTGSLPPRAVSLWVLDELRSLGRSEIEPFRDWLASCDDYAALAHPSDGTAWVLRLGDDAARWVHLHPGRHSPNTMRVRANVIKTAFLAALHARVHGSDPMGRDVVNAVRREFLSLAPLGHDPAVELGLGAVIAVLRPPERPQVPAGERPQAGQVEPGAPA